MNTNILSLTKLNYFLKVKFYKKKNHENYTFNVNLKRKK